MIRARSDVFTETPEVLTSSYAIWCVLYFLSHNHHVGDWNRDSSV